jgi:hypothetical protein
VSTTSPLKSFPINHLPRILGCRYRQWGEYAISHPGSIPVPELPQTATEHQTRCSARVLPLDTEYLQAQNGNMPATENCSELNERGPSADAACLGRFMLLASSAYLCFCLGLWAQTSESQPPDAKQSWTATRESQSDNVNPTRTVESHSQIGNRTLDKQSLQRRGPDGNFEPYQDIEKESVQVNPSTVRTTIRTFGRDGSGAKTLLQVTEEETQSLPSGDSRSVRATSNPDINGKLQLAQREIAETKKISRDAEETRTTVMQPSINGGLAPVTQIEERQQRNGNNTEFKKTTLVPDGGGNWQVSEVRQGTIKEEGKSRSTDERVSRPDPEGKLGEVSRTVSKEAETASGEKHNLVETYSTDLPGSARDGSLHLVQRVTTTQPASSTGQQTTVQQLEQPNPGDPGAGLRVTALTTDTVRSGPSGAQATRTVQVRDASGSLGVVSVDTAKSDNVHAIQVQIAPSDKPK